MSKKINMFISHCGDDEEFIPKFKKLMSDKYEIRDGSLVKSDPNNAHNKEYIKSIIRDQISWAGKVIVLIGSKTADRDLVDYEISYAKKNGDKRVIGVFLRGATDSDIPEELKENGDALVAWNSDKVADAIEGKNIWENTDGSPRASIDKGRGTC